MTDESNMPRCELCGEPMPEGETMFKFHGFSGPCPAPPLPRPASIDWQTSYECALARIAALEAELAERTRERDEARMHFAMVAMHFPDGDLTISAVRRQAEEWLREHDAAERERREAAEALLRDAADALNGGER